MSLEEPAYPIETAPEPANPAPEEKPAAKEMKVKKAPRPKKPKSAPAHPPYFEVLSYFVDAIII